MDSLCGSRSRRLSLETAKFLRVPFRIVGHQTIYRYVLFGGSLCLTYRSPTTGDWRWVTTTEAILQYAERAYGLELYEPHEEESR